MEFSIIVLLASFAIMLAFNVPISISIGISTLLTMLFTIDAGPAVTTIAQRTASGIISFALLAIPFFILSGILLGRGGIAHRLIEFARVGCGMLSRGLACVSLIRCPLLGAISGSAVCVTPAIGG